ncbi:MAG: hypothetical protein ACJ75T_06640 [Solirubrobacterales bacterium]
MQTMAPPEDALAERFARLDERIVGVDRRIAEAAKESNRQFAEVNRRITEGREETNRRFDQFEGETNRRFDRVESDIGDLKRGLAGVQTTLNRVGVGVMLTFASVLLTKAF